MAADVESMFYVRKKPWHGIGIVVKDAPDSKCSVKHSLSRIFAFLIFPFIGNDRYDNRIIDKYIKISSVFFIT